jgi:hypothetical protein
MEETKFQEHKPCIMDTEKVLVSGHHYIVQLTNQYL